MIKSIPGIAFILVLMSFSGKSIYQTSTIKAGIYTAHKVTSLWLSAAYGPYLVLGDDSVLTEITPGNGGIHLSISNDSVRVRADGKLVGKARYVRLAGKEAPNSFNIKPLSPGLKERVYDDNLLVSVSGGGLKMINIVNLERYVAGVVESENGINQNFEYYKMKSIICRTYALTNIDRHLNEGFSLCDQVHCQVYGGKNRGNDEIIMAAMSTSGIVIVDSDLKLITAAFHSNCGGKTVNSEDVWPRETSYLKSVVDTFCHVQPHAQWEKKISQKDWINYISTNYSLCDSLDTLCAIYYHPEEREHDYHTEYFRIPLKYARTKYNLRSTWFSIDPSGNQLILRGRGYGHGVGLCQEGAMRMAKLGYRYQDILHFYYKDIHLVDLSVLELFKPEP